LHTVSYDTKRYVDPRSLHAGDPLYLPYLKVLYRLVYSPAPRGLGFHGLSFAPQ
jgi:hypothetical protein